MSAIIVPRRGGSCPAPIAPCSQPSSCSLLESIELNRDRRMDFQEIDYLEREVTEHVHSQLGEYSRSHYTINYEDFTAECVVEVRPPAASFMCHKAGLSRPHSSWTRFNVLL